MNQWRAAGATIRSVDAGAIKKVSRNFDIPAACHTKLLIRRENKKAAAVCAAPPHGRCRDKPTVSASNYA